MIRNSKRAVLGVLVTCLALALVGGGCGDKFDPDKCKDLAGQCDAAGLQRCLATMDGNEVCAPNDDGCLVWTAGLPCGPGQTCVEADGTCRCNNACSQAGGTECAGNVIRTCTANEAGCLAWVAGEDCAATGLVCDEGAGQAVCARTCTDACDASQRRCDANMLQGCAREANGCLGWVDLQDCAAEDAACVFVAGQPLCQENCQDQCATADYPQCSEDHTARLTCVNQMDGCTDIVTTQCGDGNICDDTLDPPACVLDCSAACTLDATRCTDDLRAVETCQAVQDACPAFAQTDACEVGEICELAADVASCVACVADCDGKECGDDGCGGECAPGCDPVTEVCNAEGQCVNACVPDCANKDCGPDGCGDVCGECEDGEACNPQQLCQAVTCVDPVLDGSFEAGSPSAVWVEASTQFGSPMCSAATCGQDLAADGDWYVWFGGTDDIEEGSMTQDLVIPASDFANLSFGFGIGGSAEGANPNDFMEVTIDGTQVFLALRSEQADYPLYTLVTVDVTAFADGQNHTLQFRSYTENVATKSSSFLLDLVWIDACTWGGCVDECAAAGFPACNVNGNLDTCVAQADGCTDLFSTPCGAGESCQGEAGAAACVAGCVNDCDPAGYPMCAAVGEAIETCVMQGDGCYDVVSTDCNAGETCELPGGVPTCVVGCADECVAANFPACSADNLAVETCVVQADGCYDLVSTACGLNEMCVDAGGNPVCQPTCMDQCNTVGDTRCDGDMVQECQVQVSGCRDWSDLLDCTLTGETCQVSGGVAACVGGLQGDTCAAPIVVSSLPFNITGADITADYNNDLTLDDLTCETANGPDVVFEVSLTAGQVLVVTETGGMDNVRHILDTCDATAACLASADDPDANPLTYTATADGTYYVVVETYSANPFTRDYNISIDVVTPICTPGETQCSLDGRAIETCNASGTAWTPTSTCQFGCDALADPVVCKAQPLVVINEVAYDDVGTDEFEFIELFGIPATSLSGYTLVHYNGSNGAITWQADLSTLTIPADGFLVIGAAAVPNLDVDWTTLIAGSPALQNDNESLVLYTGWDGSTGTVVDAIGYETFNNMDTFFSETSPAPAATFDNSLCRHQDGFDTDDNSVDFRSGWWRTPGAANLPREPAGGFSRWWAALPAPVAITDNDPTGVTVTLDLTAAGAPMPATITDMNIAIYVTHTYKSDLEITLSNGTTSVILHNNTGGSADNVITGYDWITPVGDPALTLDAFNGSDPHAVWTLTAVDSFSGDTGAIQDFALYFQ